MKRAGHLMEKIADMDNLYIAYYKACRGKQTKSSTIAYSKDVAGHLQRLRLQLLSNTLSIGNYHYFHIYDPKLRLICAADFQERVMHHALINVCHPYFERNLIADTYATRLGKGIYAAIDKARAAMKRYPYVAKLDIRKYFDSISHEVLKMKLCTLFKDVSLLSVFNSIIDSYSVGDDRGLPIGNLTSQYFANFYLSSLDHWLKEFVKVPAYTRYMDDMLLFAEHKEDLKKYVMLVDAYLSEKLHLLQKPPVFYRSEQGVPFLGYRLYPRKLLLNGRSKRRFKEKMCRYGRYMEEHLWSERQYQDHIIPLLAFAQKAYTKQYRTVLLKTADVI